jgi:two-component system response regulator HydG
MATSTTRIEPLAVIEKRAILAAVKAMNGDKLGAAKKLGIGKTTMYRKLKEFGKA